MTPWQVPTQRTHSAVPAYVGYGHGYTGPQVRAHAILCGCNASVRNICPVLHPQAWSTSLSALCSWLLGRQCLKCTNEVGRTGARLQLAVRIAASGGVPALLWWADSSDAWRLCWIDSAKTCLGSLILTALCELSWRSPLDHDLPVWASGRRQKAVSNGAVDHC